MTAPRIQLATLAATAAFAALAIVACKKTEVTPEELDARAQAAIVAKTPPPTASAADAASDAGPSMKALTYAGKYTVSAGKMYVPDQKDWSSVKFKNDETKMLGDGEITLSVDGAGRVSGSTEAGPLGASVLEGTSDGTTLTATVRRKDPSDEGLTGTLVAKIAGDALDGTMKLAESNAAVVREAKLEAKAKK
ncbi:MAG: hypothetical protein JWO86_6899 [Myxococcaceae bacterium]|nr:hypothetical protein [Myxococcaceae bacterium]